MTRERQGASLACRYQVIITQSVGALWRWPGTAESFSDKKETKVNKFSYKTPCCIRGSTAGWSSRTLLLWATILQLQSLSPFFWNALNLYTVCGRCWKALTLTQFGLACSSHEAQSKGTEDFPHSPLVSEFFVYFLFSLPAITSSCQRLSMLILYAAVNLLRTGAFLWLLSCALVFTGHSKRQLMFSCGWRETVEDDSEGHEIGGPEPSLSDVAVLVLNDGWRWRSLLLPKASNTSPQG